MAFQPVPDVAQIDVVFTLNGVFVQNSFYAKLTGGYALADLQALADQIDLRIQGVWKLAMPAEAVYIRTDARGLASENDLVASSFVSAGPGVHPGAALPNNVAFSIKKMSGLTGRSARGRTYWLGVPSNVITPGNENLVTSTWALLAVAGVTSIRTGIPLVGLWEPVLVSRFTGGVQRPFGITFPWTGEMNVDLRVDTMRGRLPKF